VAKGPSAYLFFLSSYFYLFLFGRRHTGAALAHSAPAARQASKQHSSAAEREQTKNLN
jgi:hypothetical protein